VYGEPWRPNIRDACKFHVPTGEKPQRLAPLRSANLGHQPCTRAEGEAPRVVHDKIMAIRAGKGVSDGIRYAPADNQFWPVTGQLGFVMRARTRTMRLPVKPKGKS